MTRTQRLWLVYGLAGLLVAALAVVLTISSDHEQQPALTIAIGFTVGWAFIGSGIVSRIALPENRTGSLLLAVGFAIFLGALSDSNSGWLAALGSAFGLLFLCIFVQLVLAFPTGRLDSRLSRLVVIGAYPAVLLEGLSEALLHPQLNGGCARCPPNPYLLTSSRTARDVANVVFSGVGIALAIAIVVLIALRWRRATPTGRRVLAPILAAGGLTLLFVLAGSLIERVSSVASGAFAIAALITFTLVPIFFAAGLLRGRLSAPGLQMLREVPNDPTPEEAEAGLRRALGDPSLQLAYWLPERNAYVDVHGEHYEPPQTSSRRHTTLVEWEGERLAALVHDPVLLERPAMLENVLAAARLALHRDRLLVDLRARVGRYRALLDAMPDLMFRISRDGTYLGYNAPFGRDLIPGDVVGRTVWERLTDELADRVMEASRRAVEEGRTQTLEYTLDFDGEPRAYEGRVAAAGEEFLFIVREITDRLQQQQELEASRARIVEAGDAERRRLERNLHDGAQQRLVSLSLSLRLIENSLRSNPDAAEKLLESSRDELAQALEELRELARGIHPAILTDRGLDAALEALAARAPLPVEIRSTHEELPRPVEAAAYYVVSEALANVTKYARASSVKVEVARSNGYASVEVSDDGVGGADPALGSGLRGLADRVSALNGTLEIESRPGEGTCIRAEIPIGLG